jgi:hypothetical protein
MIVTQLPGDLLGRPQIEEEPLDRSTQTSIAGQLGSSRTTGSARRSGLCPDRPIALPATVGADLAGHGRGCPAELPRDQPEGLARPQATTDLLALGV